MKNRKRLFKALALLLTLILLLGTASTGADDEGSDPSDPVYSDWLNLNDLRKNQGEKSGNRSGTGQSSDLTAFLDSIEITGAVKNEQGKYVIVAGTPYTVHMHFSEKTNGIQFKADENGCVLTYHFPDGFSSLDTSGTVEMSGDDGVVRFNYVVSGNTVTVTFDTTSPGYPTFLTAEDAEIELDISGIINQEEVHFSTEVSGEFDIDDRREVSVQKVGQYDAALNKIKYTVRASSIGNNTDIHIGDIITGTALTYDPNSLTVSSNLGNPVQYNMDTRAGETFGLTIPSMAHGETVTIEYYTDVNLSGLTSTGNGRYGTIEQTGNSVHISSHDDPPGHDITISEKDFYNRIELSGNSKTASAQTVRDGKTYVTWTIVLNENANISIAGRSVTDTIVGPSQQFMRYSGTGIHIEKYEKDGTPAGSGDVRWGTNGLTASSGGSTWTYTIPDSDAGHAYRYVITYETEVDSDAFLIPTPVNNTVRNDYDTDYGETSVEPTGEGVEAEKSVKQSSVDPVNKEAETEWEITFTVPADGLDSAVIIDSLPGIYNYADNVWNYDTYKANSVRTADGDLLPGESFTVNSSPENHTVTITFTKNNGEPGLTGTGLTRTIHVYLKTTASHDWLVFAESHREARTHLNNAVVQVNGQEIHVHSPVNYNTTEYDIEKVLDHIYYTINNLPIYRYKIILTGLNDDVFDENGYLTITDHYDSEYLAFHPTYETYEGYNVNSMNGRIFGNNQWNKDSLSVMGEYVVDEQASSPGELIFKLHKDHLPMIDSSYCPYYSIVYSLQIKDAGTLAGMKQEALHNDGLKVEMGNTVYSEEFGTNTIITDYTVKALDKKLLSEEDNSSTGTHDLHFSIDVNPEGLKIGDANTITVKDTISNLSFDYTSVEILDLQPGDTMNRVGNSLIFTLHNETPYTIKYTARLIGIQNVHWNNKAEVFGYTSGVSGTSSVHSSGSGSYHTYSMNIKKYAEGDMNQGLAATFEIYEARVKDSYGNDISNPVWTKVGEFTTPDGTGTRKIRTVAGPGETARSLRPYSFHDTDGNERFGNDGSEKYGWRYKVKETVAPAGYQRTNTEYEFGISDIPYYIAPYNYLNDDTVTIPNPPYVPQTDVEISGEKILNGRDLKDQEFTFTLRPEASTAALWGEGYPGGFDGILTTKNDADGVFSFSLNFTYDDYTKAKQRGFADANQSAYFYYVVQEEIPEEADENNKWKGVRYDTSKFLAVVRLYMEDGEMKAEKRYYSYDGNSIPNEVPKPPMSYMARLHVTGRAAK